MRHSLQDQTIVLTSLFDCSADYDQILPVSRTYPMNARTPLKPQGAALSSSGSRPRARAVQSIPTVEEAKRRLAEAAGRPEPWLTPEGMAMLEAGRGGQRRRVRTETYQPSDAE